MIIHVTFFKQNVEHAKIRCLKYLNKPNGEALVELHLVHLFTCYKKLNSVKIAE